MRNKGQRRFAHTEQSVNRTQKPFCTRIALHISCEQNRICFVRFAYASFADVRRDGYGLISGIRQRTHLAQACVETVAATKTTRFAQTCVETAISVSCANSIYTGTSCTNVRGDGNSATAVASRMNVCRDSIAALRPHFARMCEETGMCKPPCAKRRVVPDPAKYEQSVKS